MTSSTQNGFAEEQQAEIEPEALRWLEKSELEGIGRKADAWLAAHHEIVTTLPVGTVVIINIATGEHVAAPTDEQAEADFRSKFGKGTRGFVHRVGRPTTIGGGWWALHKAP